MEAECRKRDRSGSNIKKLFPSYRQNNGKGSIVPILWRFSELNFTYYVNNNNYGPSFITLNEAMVFIID